MIDADKRRIIIINKVMEGIGKARSPHVANHSLAVTEGARDAGQRCCGRDEPLPHPAFTSSSQHVQRAVNLYHSQRSSRRLVSKSSLCYSNNAVCYLDQSTAEHFTFPDSNHEW